MSKVMLKVLKDVRLETIDEQLERDRKEGIMRISYNFYKYNKVNWIFVKLKNIKHFRVEKIWNIYYL